MMMYINVFYIVALHTAAFKQSTSLYHWRAKTPSSVAAASFAYKWTCVDFKHNTLTKALSIMERFLRILIGCAMCLPKVLQ